MNVSSRYRNIGISKPDSNFLTSDLPCFLWVQVPIHAFVALENGWMLL